MSFRETKTKFEDRFFYLKILEVKNALFAFFYEGEIKVGTLALALPRMERAGGGASSVLIGSRFAVTARVLAEKFAERFNKMSFVSINVNLPEAKALKVSVSLFNKLLPE
ncbi:TPA: hypothetical protein EYP26_04935 [Candidatus Bathyarchaeota archaeon]|nr:hypothetical protein [Candidatus Bathyarchaeota archaeon]